MGPGVIYTPFLLTNNQILGKPVLNKRPLSKFCRIREKEHHPESSEEMIASGNQKNILENLL